MSNTRTVTAIVAFVAAFIFSAGLVRIIMPAPVVRYVYAERPRPLERRTNEIEKFLLRDIQNGENRASYDTRADYPASVMEYWKASSSMDASRFPQDFQDAWRAHMQAWGNYAEFLNAAKKSSASRNDDGRLNNEINRTWQEVLRIGRTHGAYVE